MCRSCTAVPRTVGDDVIAASHTSEQLLDISIVLGLDRFFVQRCTRTTYRGLIDVLNLWTVDGDSLAIDLGYRIDRSRGLSDAQNKE